MDLLETLIILSEKAARIARLIRKDEELFRLLVEQKSTSEANPRFVDDFKTLADVLIQEMIKYFLDLAFPGFADRVRGEESNKFCNILGDKIIVEIKNSPEETAELLEKVLDGNEKAASLLAEEVHKTIKIEEVNTIIPKNSCKFDLSKLGVWIDPIDSTAEYINATGEVSGQNEESGLICVTVLIGVYDIETSEAVIGVVNQPFHSLIGKSWSGECTWGVCHNSAKSNSLNSTSLKSGNVYLSSSENETVKKELKEKGYKIKEVPGAGNKLLKVIKGLGDCYVLSKGTTFKWDTCGPHAILRSLGGDIVNYSDLIDGRIVSVKYPHDLDEKGNCNDSGLLAFRSSDILKDFLKV